MERPITSLGLPSMMRLKKEQWQVSLYKDLGAKRPACHANLHYSAYDNMHDAVAALNGDPDRALQERPKPAPKAIAKAGFCTIFSKRQRIYYLMWKNGLREQAFKAFGFDFWKGGEEAAG